MNDHSTLEMDPSALTRFWGRVHRSGECWLWTGAPSSAGYGSMDINGKRWSAHRLSYRIHVGIIPDGLFVCHHCDNRLCVRPEHLFVGTAFDNVHDMIRKGRDDRRNGRGGACGSKHGLARLTECQVVEMRRAYALGEGSYGTLAMRFGVHTKTVAGIIQGKEWKHILPG